MDGKSGKTTLIVRTESLANFQVFSSNCSWKTGESKLLIQVKDLHNNQYTSSVALLNIEWTIPEVRTFNKLQFESVLLVISGASILKENPRP